MNVFATAVVIAAGLWWTPPSAGETEITWDPPRPVQGSIVLLRVRPAAFAGVAGPVVMVRGVLAGQALHFEPSGDGSFSALGGVPISTRDSLAVTLAFEHQTGVEHEMTVYMAITRGRFPLERLSVAPGFTTPPNAALRRRIARERAASRAAWRRSFETPRLWSAPFVRPRPSRITSAYGMGREFNGVVRSRHMGTDFAGDYGAPVRAANRGVVRLVGHFYYSGRLIYIDHGRGLLTAYLHLSRIDVAEGDVVERGQIIGRVGATGRVTGPHLHWIARYGAVSANPLSLLALNAQGFSAAGAPDVSSP